MTVFDFLFCCGARKDKLPPSRPGSPTVETVSLLHPRQNGSILSSEGGMSPVGYGAVVIEGGGERLTEEQRERIKTIGREVGTYMLPIESMPPRSHLSISRASTTPLSTSSTRSSPSSSDIFSPIMMGHVPEPSNRIGGEKTPRAEQNVLGSGEENGVIRKTLFAGGAPLTLGGRRTSGRGKTRGKAKVKGKR
ncbi:uncharacterized protein L203_101381 [Cryptococcus depauperatus CBS 7841]|uniref:Uncharacterized protein n=1 Tax=Cryptococcus depauperatus CBS 7841 TaxID=1295531 RepID=A0A1E3IEG5_9TREE|nr:hypothetical protein L203_04259 [Cryptococcus depauperatus CBS 7841]